MRHEKQCNAACRDCGSTGHNTGSNTCPGPDEQDKVIDPNKNDRFPHHSNMIWGSPIRKQSWAKEVRMSTKTEVKHTPGQWETKPEHNYVPAQIWSEGRQLAEVYGEDLVITAANARLMAAAPDLLEALEIVEQNCPCFAIDQKNRKHIAGCRIEAAIRKARGE
jgi:hypothetical protein